MILTAEQARQRTKTIMSVYEQSQLEQINKESGQGYFKYYDNGELRLTVKEKLEELGYKVMTNVQYNEPEYCISWR